MLTNMETKRKIAKDWAYKIKNKDEDGYPGTIFDEEELGFQRGLINQNHERLEQKYRKGIVDSEKPTVFTELLLLWARTVWAMHQGYNVIMELVLHDIERHLKTEFGWNVVKGVPEKAGEEENSENDQSEMEVEYIENGQRPMSGDNVEEDQDILLLYDENEITIQSMIEGNDNVGEVVKPPTSARKKQSKAQLRW